MGTVTVMQLKVVTLMPLQRDFFCFTGHVKENLSLARIGTFTNYRPVSVKCGPIVLAITLHTF